MEEKVFDLLEKLYVKVTGIESDVKNVKNDVGSLKEEVGSLKEEVGNIKEEVGKSRQDIVRLESELKGKISLLTDGYMQTYEILNEVRSDIKELKQKVEKQELEITVIKKAI